MTAALAVAPIEPAEAADPALVAAIIAMWEACRLTRPWNDPAADIALAARGPDSTILLGRVEGTLAATVMVGHDGHRGAVYYLAVSREARGHGHGRTMMDAAEDWLRGRGVPKLNLMVRRDNLAVGGFYDALGYGEDDVVVRSKRL